MLRRFRQHLWDMDQRSALHPGKQMSECLLGIGGAAAAAEKDLDAGGSDQFPIAAVCLRRRDCRRLLHRTVPGDRKPAAPPHLIGAPLGGVAALIVDLRLDGIDQILLFQPERLLREGVALQLRLQQDLPQQLGAAPADTLPLQRKAVVRPGDGKGEQLVFPVTGYIGIQHRPIQIGQPALQLGHIPAAAAAHPQKIGRQRRGGGFPFLQRRYQRHRDAVMIKFRVVNAGKPHAICNGAALQGVCHVVTPEQDFLKVPCRRKAG